MAAETELGTDLHLDEEGVDRLVSIIEARWPGWTGFDDERYVAEAGRALLADLLPAVAPPAPQPPPEPPPA